jgi:hypothetical protein
MGEVNIGSVASLDFIGAATVGLYFTVIGKVKI